MALAVNDGMALSTPEGPRPLGAYGAVLFGKGWRAFVLQREEELQDLVEWAVLRRRPILTDQWNSLLFADIIATGYRPMDPFPSLEGNRGIYRSKFESGGRQLSVFSFDNPSDLCDAERLSDLASITEGREILLSVEYSSTLQVCKNIIPQALTPISPFAAVLDLEALK
jgi:hypothetical protein